MMHCCLYAMAEVGARLGQGWVKALWVETFQPRPMLGGCTAEQDIMIRRHPCTHAAEGALQLAHVLGQGWAATCSQVQASKPTQLVIAP